MRRDHRPPTRSTSSLGHPRRWSAAAAATLALVGILAGMLPAGASPEGGDPQPVVVADRAGDGRGSGDIRGFRISQTGAANQPLTMQIRTARPLDLGASRAFRAPNSASLLRFNIDTDGDPSAEVVIFVERSRGGPRVEFEHPGWEVGAAPEGTCATLHQPRLDLIRVTVQRSCLDPVRRVSEVRGSARYRLDLGGDGSLDSDDRVPRAFSPTFHIVD